MPHGTSYVPRPPPLRIHLLLLFLIFVSLGCLPHRPPCSTYGLCARLYLLYSWSCYKCDINVPRRAAFSHRMSFLIKLSALVQFAGLSSLCPLPRPLRPLLVTYAQQSTPMPLLGVLRVCEGATARLMRIYRAQNPRHVGNAKGQSRGEKESGGKRSAINASVQKC